MGDSVCWGLRTQLLLGSIAVVGTIYGALFFEPGAEVMSHVLAPGDRVGAYEIVERLGAGRFSQRYLGRDLRLNRTVTIKQLWWSTLDAEQRDRIQQAFRILASINHPSFPSFYELVEQDEGLFQVTEPLLGSSLRERLRSGRIAHPEAVHYARQIAQGLETLHSRGLVHGHLNPDHVLVAKDGAVKILDVGLWQPPGEAPDTGPRSRQLAFSDRLAYLAPEQLFGHGGDPSSDVYALGAILYEMLTGRPPFVRRSTAETLEAIQHETPERLDVGPFGHIVERCLAKQPAERPSAAALVGTLEGLRSGVDLPFRFDVPHASVIAGHRKLIGKILLAVLGVVIVAMAAIWLAPLGLPPTRGVPQPRGVAPGVLFSAAWFSGSSVDPRTVDLPDGAQAFLRANTPYKLKFAIQDREFPAPPVPEESYRSERLRAGGLKPGDVLEVSYSADALEPRENSAVLEVARAGESAVASFDVRPIRAVSGGSPVRLDVRFKGLPFYAAVLHPIIVPEGEEPPPPSSPAWTRGSHVVASAAAVNYAPQRAGDVLILVTPSQGDSRFSIRIDWLGRERVDGKSGFTPNELRRRLEATRSQIEDTHRDAVFKGALDGDRVEPAVRQRLLRRLAILGATLHRELFQDPKLQAILSRIKAASLQNPGMHVRIEHAASDDPAYPKRMMLPFGLLYDDSALKLDERESADVNVRHFWDYRYLVEFVDSRMLYRRGSFCPDGPMRMAVVMDVGSADRQSSEDWRAEVDRQKTAIEALPGRPLVSYVRDEDSFRQIFRGLSKPTDLIYFYGHTNSGPSPSFDLTGNKLSIDQVKEDAEQNTAQLLRDHPVVILNSCRGAAFSGDTYNTFLDLMGNLQSSAFVATEASIGVGYGAVVGERLLLGLSTGGANRTLLDVVSQMKHDALEHENGNPMMLLYSVFGDPFVRACSP